ncbi:MAG: nickel-responsive transcriptional regulator NikR [Candidatus Bathyarchaeia archaeon]
MRGKDSIIRFSVSLPPSIVKEFDDVWRSMGYESRSKAVHDAIQSFISELKWTFSGAEHVAGAILICYYLDKPDIVEKIMSLQHKFMDIIISTTHVHLKEDICLEIIAVNGETSEIKKLAEEIMTKKGVKQVKVAVISP